MAKDKSRSGRKIGRNKIRGQAAIRSADRRKPTRRTCGSRKTVSAGGGECSGSSRPICSWSSNTRSRSASTNPIYRLPERNADCDDRPRPRPRANSHRWRYCNRKLEGTAMTSLERHGLCMKYFVLNPWKQDRYGAASRAALRAYADSIESKNLTLATDLRLWANALDHKRGRREIS